MSHRHPIDDLFRRRLKNQHEAPPMHVWDRIQENRRRQPPVTSAFGKFLAAASIALLLCLLQADGLQFPNEEMKFAGTKPIDSDTKAVLADVPNEHVHAKSLSNRLSTPTSLSTSKDVKSASPTYVEVINMDANSDRFTQVVPEEAELSGGADPISLSKLNQPVELPVLEKIFIKNRSYPSPSQCASFRSAGWKIFAEWMTGPEVSFRKLASMDESAENLGYNNIRQQTEAVLPGYGAQLRIAAASRSGLLIRSGLHYARQREQLRHVTETEQRFTIINLLGPTGEIVGVDTVYETIIREERLPIRYQTLSIPLLAGFEKRFGRLSVGIMGGAMANIMFRQKGSIYLPAGDMPVSFANAKAEGNELFQPRLGLGWYAGASLAWKIHPNVEITAEPHARAFPRSFNPSDFPTHQKYVHSGIAIGMRFAI
jgi:hypothetical protein